MSTVVVALISAAAGALLTGATDLVFAWRRETRDARIGTSVVRELLGIAQKRLSEVRAPNGGWWAVGSGPLTQPWEQYRESLADRLPQDLHVELEKTFATLEALNAYARERREYADLLQVKSIDAKVGAAQAD